MAGTVELVDGNWVLRDYAGREYLLGAEASQPYAEPGMAGTVELVDGHWVLRDGAGREYLLGAEATPPYAEPGMAGTVELVDGRWVLRDYTGREYLLGAEASLPYAEPGMAGTVELVEGYWVLKDNADAIYQIPFTEEAVSRLQEAFFRDGAETVIPYAEPGMSGTVALIDGYWVLKDEADTLYLLPSPRDALVRLQEARSSDRAEADSAYTDPDALFRLLTGEPRFPDRPEVSVSMPHVELARALPDSPGYLPESEARLRKIYDAILSIETASSRQPEVIMDLGPIGKERYAGETAGEDNATLLLIKNLSGGKYYLQIGLFDRKDVLARKLTDLNWAYPYALETAGSAHSPEYKLLVGPVNEGESNALLLRFRRYGYHDAFIRREG
jgi:hypothetical protein